MAHLEVRVTIALIIVATLLGIASVGSAVQKFRRDARVMESMHSVGVSDGQIPVLGVLELIGAAGLLVGIWATGIGIAAAIGLSLYFVGAVVSHIRVKAPMGDAAPAIMLMLISLATLVLELTR